MTENEAKSIDLEDIFSLGGHSRKQFVIKFSSNILSIYLKNKSRNSNQSTSNNKLVRTLSIDDIYGCLYMKGENNSNQSHLCLYLYTLKPSSTNKKRLPQNKRFHRSELILTCSKFSDFDRNLAEVTRWHDAIMHSIYFNRNLPIDIAVTKRDKPVLVFVNPAGGSGKAQRLFLEYVVGVWGQAQYNYHMIITEYAGNALDYVKTICIDDWSGIVLASGDGLIYEVINGLMSRADWKEAMKLPIGHIPCGSGNAFITNVLRYGKLPMMEPLEKYVVQAAILITTHDIIPFDLTVVNTCDGQRIFSFLSIAWGIIADIDCESEKYRFLGEARFTVEAVKRILHPRVYNGHIDYIPHEDDDSTANSDLSNINIHPHLLPINEEIPIDSPGSKWRRIKGPFAHVLITSKSSISKDVVAVSESTLADGYLTLQYIRSNASTRKNLAKVFTKLSDGTHSEYTFLERIRIRAFRVVPYDSYGNIMVDGEKVAFGLIQGEIMSNIARCMGRHPKFEQVSINT